MEVRYLVEKWSIYDVHIFPRSLVKTCSLESTSLCLHTRLRVNKNFQILIILIEIDVKHWMLCAHLVMKSINFFLEDLSDNKKSVMHLVFIFQLILFFCILRNWIARYSHRSIAPHEVCTKEFQVLGGQKSCKEVK